MAGGTKFSLRTADFDATLKKYLKTSKKTFAEAMNQKAFWIMVKAAQHTPKADVKKMRKALTWNKGSANRLRAWALKHQPQLETDKERKAYFNDLKKKRGKSMGYLKAGWITPIAIAKRAGGIDGKSKVKGATQRGKKKGKMEPAKAGFKVKVTFENMTGAMAGSDKKYAGEKYSQAEAAKKFGEPALAKGFRIELASMKRYLSKKMKDAANKTGMGK